MAEPTPAANPDNPWSFHRLCQNICLILEYFDINNGQNQFINKSCGLKTISMVVRSKILIYDKNQQNL